MFTAADRTAYLILLTLSLVLGYLIACCTAAFSRPGNRLAFVRKNGFALAMSVLVAFPSAFFSALFVAFAVTYALDTWSQHPLSKVQRSMVMEGAYILCFVAMVIYAAREVTKDKAPPKPTPNPLH